MISSKQTSILVLAILASGFIVIPSASFAFAQTPKEVSQGLIQAADEANERVKADFQKLGDLKVSNETSEGNQTGSSAGGNETQGNGTGSGPVVIIDNGTSNGNTTIPSEGNQTTVKEAKLKASVAVSADSVKRGGAEVIFVAAYDENNNNVIKGAAVSGQVTYPSGFVKSFNGQTDELGSFAQLVKIGGNAKTGEFKVNVSVAGINQTASDSKNFNVEKAK